MTRPIEVLQQDHRNMARILDIIDAEMAKLEAGGSADLELVGHIIDYCLQYPDRYHHPLEDMVLRKLQQRSPEAATKVGDLEASHRDLANLTEQMGTALEDIASGAEISRQAVAQLTEKFVSTYKKHIEMEDIGFFPSAIANLTDQDWQMIEKEMTPSDDPLFAQREIASLVDLRREIFRWAEE